MAWGNQGINHYVYGAGAWSIYYWNASYNPGATFQLCMANCTTYAYGRVRENGLPIPVTQFRNANNWHYYVNTSAGWTLLNYSSGMALQPGDILEWSANHVAVVESNGTDPWVSGSWYTGDDGTAASDRSYLGMGGSTLQDVSNWMVANASRRFYRYERMTSVNSTAGGGAYPVYVIRYNGSSPSTETPDVTVSPSSYNTVMSSDNDYVDFVFNVTVTGIPAGYTATGNNTYPGLDRVYNTGWSYTDYVVDGVTYRRATKTQTLRYYREQDTAYTVTKYMYYSFSYPNGSASSTTPMTIAVQAKATDDLLLIANLVLNRKKKRFNVRIY